MDFPKVNKLSGVTIYCENQCHLYINCWKMTDDLDDERVIIKMD
jgi:hypothetical protein